MDTQFFIQTLVQLKISANRCCIRRGDGHQDKNYSFKPLIASTLRKHGTDVTAR